MATARLSSFHRLSVVASLAVAACGDGRGTPTQLQPEQFTQCTSTTAITVARVSGEIRFSWAPTCGAGVFTVQNEGGTATLWSVTRPDGMATMAGPIVYGTVPAGAQASGAAPPLQAGTIVRVTLSGGSSSGVPAAVITSAQITVP